MSLIPDAASRRRELVALILCVLLAGPSWPATIVVQGSCTLVEAIISANTDTPGLACPAGMGPDTIVLTHDVILSSIAAIDIGYNGLPTITSPITIEGQNYKIERNPAAPEFRIARIASTGDLTLNRVTVSGGRETIAGGFYNEGELTLRNSTLSFNSAEVRGGALYNYDLGEIEIYRSTVSSNSVSGFGFPRIFGGAISNGYPATLRVTDSLITGNTLGTSAFFTGDAYGGAILNDGGKLIVSGSTFSNNTIGYAGTIERGSAIANFSPDPDSIITNTTISGNGNSSLIVTAAAVYVHQFMVLDHVTLSGNRDLAIRTGAIQDLRIGSTIIANTSGGSNCSGSFTDEGDNIADDSSCGTIPSGLTGLDSVLADNGGPTETHALLPGSNAIDAGGLCRGVDQRGASRVGVCDIGAFEYLGCPLLTLADETITTVEVYEECSVWVGPNLAVAGPGGDLTVRFGTRGTFAEGFSVAIDAELTVEHDASLQLLRPELIEADRAWRRSREKPPDSSTAGRLRTER